MNVSDDHTYFVSEKELLVHNQCTKQNLDKVFQGAGKTYQIITNSEKRIANEALEHGQFFSKAGDLIGKPIVGTERLIDISHCKEIAKDAIFTHNHPGDRQFSLQDIQTAAGFDMLEIRAVTPSGKKYSMKRGSDGWKVTDPKSIEMAQIMAQNELKNDPIAIKLFKENNQEAVWDMLFEKISKTIGGEYSVKR